MSPRNAESDVANFVGEDILICALRAMKAHPELDQAPHDVIANATANCIREHLHHYFSCRPSPRLSQHNQTD